MRLAHTTTRDSPNIRKGPRNCFSSRAVSARCKTCGNRTEITHIPTQVPGFLPILLSDLPAGYNT
jgi:hypothetical protein